MEQRLVHGIVCSDLQDNSFSDKFVANLVLTHPRAMKKENLAKSNF
jgi:hypothetical protein